MRVLAVDPSIVSAGFAVFDEGFLVRSGIVRAVADDRDIVARAVAMADALWYESGSDCEYLIAERPQIYTWAKGKGDPNDQIGMAFVVGALAAHAGAVRTFLPSEWKGQAPKHVTAARAHAILTDIELIRGPDLPVPSSKTGWDAWDAIGIGLVGLGRARRGVVPL